LFTLFWMALFYLLMWIVPKYMQRVPLSTKPKENEPAWCARNVLGSIHAVLVSILVVPAVVILFPENGDVKFGASPSLSICAVDPSDTALYPFNKTGMSVALAGLAFVTFTIADVIISAIYRLATVDYIIHHIAFISAGCIIRSHCMMPFNAAILMSMEISTPFLNYATLMRNRSERRDWVVIASGVTFAFLFFVFRLVLNTYGAFVLWAHRGRAVPQGVPKWQFWFVFIAVVIGALVQFFWFPAVVKAFMTKLDTDFLTTEGQGAAATLQDAARKGEGGLRKEAEADRAAGAPR